SRNVTTTPTQALLMINGQWMLDRAAAMARRLRQSQSADLSNLASTAYRMVHGSAASPDQLAMLVECLTGRRRRFVGDRSPVKPVTLHRPGGCRAAAIKPGSHQEYRRVERKGAFPEAAFRVEGVVRLDSMFEDASLRTIASQWN